MRKTAPKLRKKVDSNNLSKNERNAIAEYRRAVKDGTLVTQAQLEKELFDELLKNSALTEADAERIGHKIKAGIRKRLGW